MKLGTNPHLPGPGDFGGYTDGGPNPDYDDRFDAQEAELETLRQEVLTLNRVFLETAKEIGCDADNEIILEAIHNLRQSLAAETSRADMAWENTRIIDKARIAEMTQRDELTKQLSECQAREGWCAAKAAPKIPAGWKLMPIQLTAKMLDGVDKGWNNFTIRTWADVYKALLSDSPEYKP